MSNFVQLRPGTVLHPFVLVENLYSKYIECELGTLYTMLCCVRSLKIIIVNYLGGVI